MINNYNDFIIESLISESVVVYSTKFKDLIKGIDSPVAKALQEVESKDLKVTNNFIDIDEDKEKISFITDRRAQNILSDENREKFVIYTGNGGFLSHSEGNKELFKLLDYDPIGSKCYHPEVGDKGEVMSKVVSGSSGRTYLKVRYDNGISVINMNNTKYEDLSMLPFTQNRQNIRIGRGIRGLLTASGQKFTDSEIEEFVNKYKSEYDKMNDVFRLFDVVEGKEIAYWYNYNNYAELRNRGQLSSSCMSGVNSSFFDIYVNNPDSCKLVILKTEDGKKIKGRALLWKLTKPDGVMFLDRIYTHYESDIELFKQYAKFKKWNVKPNNQSTNDSAMIDPSGSRVDVGEITTKVNSGGYSRYPYLDTLKYYDKSNGKLTTSEDGYGDGDTYLLEDTSGGTINDEGCDYCDGSGRVDCNYCDGDGQRECSDCEGSGEMDCENCDGSGSVECGDCGGEGQNEDGSDCELCSGEGQVACDECKRGKVKCDNCDGDGELDCDYCGGDGRVDCPECG